MPILQEDITYEIMRSREKTHCCAQCPESYAGNLRTAWGQSLGYGPQYILRCDNLSHATIRPIRISPTELDQLKLLKGEFELMPIEGLSERTMLPRIGKIHLGIKHATKGYPIATDYFVLPADHPQYQDLVDKFGEKPKELRIVFPIADEEQVASQYYRQYSQSRGLVCKGDGIKCNQLTDTDTGAIAAADSKNTKWAESVCGGKECPDYMADRCKEVMNLQFMLPEIPGLGVWQIDTSSINSILNVNSQFALIKSVYGTIGMVPVILSLEPKQVKSPKDQKLKTVRVLCIRSGDTLVEALRNAMLHPLERLTGEKVLALPPGDADRPEIVIGDDDRQATSEQAQKDIKELWDGMERDDAKTAQEAEAPAEEPEPPAPNGPHIDPALLEDAKTKLKWQDNTVISFLVSQYHVDGSGTLEDVIARLTPEQAEEFCAGIQTKLDALEK